MIEHYSHFRKMFLSTTFLLLAIMSSYADDTKTVTLTEAGTLSSYIASDQKYSITSLKVSGPINGTDVKYLREMAGRDYKGNETNGNLVDLDLTDANIVAGGDAYYGRAYDILYTKDNILGDYMFYACKLKSVKLPNSVTGVGLWTFHSCTSLTSVTIGNSTTNLGVCMFTSCSSLTSVTIPHSVTSIDVAAFRNCSSLTSVTIPNSVTSIDYNAFKDCSNVETLTLEDGDSALVISNNSSLPNSIKELYLGRDLTESISRFGKIW